MVRPELAAPPGVPIATASGGVAATERRYVWPGAYFALLPLVSIWFVYGGYEALDSPAPNVGGATVAFGAGILVTAAIVVAWGRRRPHMGQWVTAAAAAGLFALWCVPLVEASYGPGWFSPSGLEVLWLLVFPVVVAFVPVAGMAWWWPAKAQWIGEAIGIGAGLGAAAAMGYLLITLDRQVAMAKQAHELPLPGVVWFMLVLLVCASLRRR